VFLYGLGAQYTSLWSFLGILALGSARRCSRLGAAAGQPFFSWRTFFRVSEILLLLLAGALSSPPSTS
jgi:high-affinity iron transporter